MRFKYILIISLFVAALNSFADDDKPVTESSEEPEKPKTTYYSARSQGTEAIEEMLGWQRLIDKIKEFEVQYASDDTILQEAYRRTFPSPHHSVKEFQDEANQACQERSMLSTFSACET